MLNLILESREFPYTSLKYPVLLVTSLFYNFTQGYDIKDLYLTEDLPESKFQIIYQDHQRTWSLIPKKGMGRVYSNFSLSWKRRTRPTSLGGEHQILDDILNTIPSWSMALSVIEDYINLLKMV